VRPTAKRRIEISHWEQSTISWANDGYVRQGDNLVSYSVQFDVPGTLKAPSFMPEARLVARYRKFGQILAFETKSEPTDSGFRITADVSSLEIASALDIGWLCESAFLPLVIQDALAVQ
jgi:hypothetical protein